VLRGPLDGATLDNPEVLFTWYASEGATSYTIQASQYSTFSKLIFNYTTDSQSYTYAFGNDGTYYWRVRANGDNGSSSYSSRKFYIKTVVYPDPPELLSPINGEVVKDPYVFSWSDTGADSYVVEVAFDPDFKEPAAVGKEITGTSIYEFDPVLTDLDWRITDDSDTQYPLKDGLYWWRAYSRLNGKYSEPSKPTFFTKDSTSNGDNFLLNGGFEMEENFEEKHIIYNPKLIETNYPQNYNDAGWELITPVKGELAYAYDTYWYRYLHPEKYHRLQGIKYDDENAISNGFYGLHVTVESREAEEPFKGYYEQIVPVEGLVKVDGYFREIDRSGDQLGVTGLEFVWMAEGGKPVISYKTFIDNPDTPIEKFGWQNGWYFNEYDEEVWTYGQRIAPTKDWVSLGDTHTINDLLATEPGGEPEEILNAIIAENIVIESIRVRLIVKPIASTILVAGFDDILVGPDIN
jgi:hypothetical protein